jgi:hypothetical protein
MIDGLSAGALLVDRGYDTDELLEMPVKAAMNPVIRYSRVLHKEC